MYSYIYNTYWIWCAIILGYNKSSERLKLDVNSWTSWNAIALKCLFQKLISLVRVWKHQISWETYSLIMGKDWQQVHTFHPVSYRIFFKQYWIIHNIGQFKELFKVVYSDRNTPERAAEEATYINFVDFIEKCEGKLLQFHCFHH